ERFGGGQFAELAADPAGLPPDAVRDQLAAIADRLRQGPAGGIAYLAVTLDSRPDPIILVLVDAPVADGPERALVARDPRATGPADGRSPEELLRRYPGTPTRLELLDDTALRDRIERLRQDRLAVVIATRIRAAQLGQPVSPAGARLPAGFAEALVR